MGRLSTARAFVLATVFLSFLPFGSTLTAAPQEDHRNREAIKKVLSNPKQFVIVANSQLRGKGNHEIYHVDNLKDPVATIFGYSASPMPVVGAEDLFVAESLPTFKNGLTRGLPSVYRGMGNKLDSVIIDDYQDYFLGRDLINCVKIKDGDIWLGKIDWKKGKLVENKITHTGDFGDSWPSFQSGRFIYLINKDKTFSKINTKTGEVENVKLFETLGQQFYSPDMRAMVIFTNDQVTVVDLQTGEKRQIPNTINYSHPTVPDAAKTRPYELFDVGYIKGTMVWVSPTLIVAPNHGGLSVLNLETATTDFLPIAGDYSEFSWEYHTSHHSKELELTTIDGIVIAKLIDRSIRNSTSQWFEVNPIKRTKVKLDIAPRRETWLSRYRFFNKINNRGEDQDSIRYEQTSPKLSVQLHDGADFHKYSQPYFHDKNNERLFFNCGDVNGPVWSVCELKTGKIIRLDQFDRHHDEIGAFLPPVDLGFATKEGAIEPIVSIFKTEGIAATITEVAKPSQSKSPTLAYEFCVGYDRQVLFGRAKRNERTQEEMKVLIPLFVEIAKQFSMRRATKAELLGIEYAELKIEVWKALRQSNLSPNPKQYLGIPSEVVKGVEQSLDELRQLHDAGKKVEFVGVMYGQPITPADLERTKTRRRFHLPRRLRDAAEDEEAITRLRLSLDEVDFTKAKYSKSDSTIRIGHTLNFRLNNGKWILFGQSER